MPGLFFFSSRRRHTRLQGDWSSDVCSSDLAPLGVGGAHLLVALVAAQAGQRRQLIQHLGRPVVQHAAQAQGAADQRRRDRKSTRLNSSHLVISYAVFCLKKKKKKNRHSDSVQT